jgi:hypothetical protein
MIPGSFDLISGNMRSERPIILVHNIALRTSALCSFRTSLGAALNLAARMTPNHSPRPPMALGNMYTLSLAAIITLIPCAGAMAAVLTVACSGTTRNLEGKRQEIPSMFPLTLDGEKMTLVLDDYDDLPLTPTITSPKINMNFWAGGFTA